MSDRQSPDGETARLEGHSALTLGEFASIVRSKNAGPFRLTLDVFFDSASDYARAVECDVLSADAIVGAYGVDHDDILGIYEMAELRAIKVSLRRPVPAGSPTDSDVYGAQQHSPLLDLVVE